VMTVTGPALKAVPRGTPRPGPRRVALQPSVARRARAKRALRSSPVAQAAWHPLRAEPEARARWVAKAATAPLAGTAATAP
jgi:hypothetical protein